MRHNRTLLALITGVLLMSGCAGSGTSETTSTTAVTSTTATSTTTTEPGGTTTAPPSTVATTNTTTTTAPATTTTLGVLAFTFTVTGGTVDGPDRIEIERDSTVAIIVTADVADEVHLHGYDVFADVDPQSAAVIEFVADIPGVFELELEDARLLVTEIVVR